MTHCRECNSEIAEEEGFCPHCGISLKPIGLNDAEAPGPESESPDQTTGEGFADTVADESEDIDMSETIVINPADALAAASDSSSDTEEKDDGFADAGELSSSADPSIANGKDENTEGAVESEAVVGELNDAIDEEIDMAVSVIDEKVEAWKDSALADGDPEDESVVSDQDGPADEVPDPAGAAETANTAIPAETDAVLETASEEPVVAAEENTEVTTEPGTSQSESPVDEIAESIEDESGAEEAEAVLSDTDPGNDAVSEAVDSSVAEIYEDEEMPDGVQTGQDDVGDVIETPLAADSVEADENGRDEGEPEAVSEETDPAEPEIELDESDIVETPSEDPSPSAAGINTTDAPDAAVAAASLEAIETDEEKSVPDSETAEKVAAEESGEDAPADEAASGEQEDGKQNKSMTTPNIGGPDTDGSKTPKLRPLDEGTVLNERYEIVRKIGGGGMGAVYLASDKNLGGVLRAVKEMVQSYIEKEQQDKAVQDFKRESMLLTSLEHPAIPTIYDYFFDESEGRFYLVMKYISGGDLSARLRSAPEGRLDEASITQWGVEIADVLDYLHNRQPPIVYRDLKPSNVMIDGNSGKLMLIDFGIARWVNKEEKGVTAVGTMGYAPPELFSGNVVPGSDIYSLGSTMFHLLTGADPQNNPLLIFDFQKHPRPRQINPNLSDQMERILMQAVEYNAEKRFPSAADFRNALERHLHNLKTGQVSYGITESPVSVALSDQPVFCGFCGQKIVATDMFCAFCGAKQPLAQPGIHSQEYFVPQTTAKLMVEGTSDLNLPSFDLAKKENLVGRRDPMSNIFPEVDLSKFDPQTKISRKHARIWREGDSFMLEDLGSSNGTLIIRPSSETKRLAPHQSQMLQSGDKIQVGDTTLQFLVG